MQEQLREQHANAQRLMLGGGGNVLYSRTAE